MLAICVAFIMQNGRVRMLQAILNALPEFFDCGLSVLMTREPWQTQSISFCVGFKQSLYRTNIETCREPNPHD